ncbi:MAG TPA: hypothetical protein VFZ09_32320 [Archangium sp.]|uniref:hypothetical protein n=1 Tax=Archangium sp. TaxID=1872627 RepID=UPI002E34B21B|nr:hypothetical protein [Archangium sp.]HEX5750956.1 hypothetical protein [Archangium sp.]
MFPRFFERSTVQLSADGQPYELDGAVLRAIMIAANDFLPPGGKTQPCWKRQEAHRYRIIRQGDIVFVRIDEDLESCGLQYVSLDTGVTYAIHTDGRILRRVFDGQPGAEPLPPDALDAGSPGSSPDAAVPAPVDEPSPQDGGSGPVSSGPVPAAPSAPDGGTPPVP